MPNLNPIEIKAYHNTITAAVSAADFDAAVDIIQTAIWQIDGDDAYIETDAPDFWAGGHISKWSRRDFRNRDAMENYYRQESEVARNAMIDAIAGRDKPTAPLWSSDFMTDEIARAEGDGWKLTATTVHRPTGMIYVAFLERDNGGPGNYTHEKARILLRLDGPAFLVSGWRDAA
jgi:hypothetical protein